RKRGVKSARVLDIRDIGTLKGAFASIVMYGNNFALLGSPARAKRLLTAMDRITTPEARIIGGVCNPYLTKEPAHLAYHQRNRRRGRWAGQLRIRIRFEQYVGMWFDYLFVSPEEVRKLWRTRRGKSPSMSQGGARCSWRCWRRGSAGLQACAKEAHYTQAWRPA